jgi:hypothetical protein
VLIDATAVPNQKFTAMFNQQIIMAIQGKFKPFCSQSLQGGILFGSQFNAGKSATAGCVTGGATFISIFGVIKQDAVKLFSMTLKKPHDQLLLDK